jgi:hypothetical protein
MDTGIEMICGKCHMHRKFKDHHGKNTEYTCEEACQSQFDRHGKPNNLRRMAINFTSWVKPGHGTYHIGSAALLMSSDVNELLLVMGDFKPSQWQRNVTFVSPFQDSIVTKHAMSEDDAREDGMWKHWDQLEEDIEKSMILYKEDLEPRLELVEELLRNKWHLAYTSVNAHNT